MAKKKIRTKKREKKNISTGVVHIQSTFNNTIVIQLLQLQILPEMLSLGLVQVFRALRDHGRALHLLLSLQQKMRQKRPWSMG